MSCEVHPLLVKELKVISTRIVFINKFAALEHAIRQRFVITTTDHEYTWLLYTHLNHLEIMWKVAFEIDKFMDTIFVFHVIN